jgi:hypothetical protein
LSLAQIRNVSPIDPNRISSPSASSDGPVIWLPPTRVR